MKWRTPDETPIGLLDPEDAEWASAYRGRMDRNGYPIRSAKRGEDRFLHRLVMKAEPGQVVHHKNKNRLDCRKANLMLLASAEEHTAEHLRMERERQRKHWLRRQEREEGNTEPSG